MLAEITSMDKGTSVAYGLRVGRYSKAMELQWNEFVALAKNATFFFNRGYLDYHSDRIEDFSLVVTNEKGKIVAALPANLVAGKKLVSHGGLTFGGLIIHQEEKLVNVLLYFKLVLRYLHENHIDVLYYKEIPSFYNPIPAEEDQYALFLLEAKLYRRDTAITIRQKSRLPFQKRRIRSIKSAQKLGVEIKEVHDFSAYWSQILEPNLWKRFEVKPVHSCAEITLLHSRFPNQIRQYNAYLNDELMAGTTVFETDHVAHAQYISASEEGRRNGSLDYLFAVLIEGRYADKDYFDFGICNENGGKVLNHGLLDWKEGFGGRTYSHNFYEVHTANYLRLNKYLADQF